MKNLKNPWITEAQTTITKTKHVLANLSVYVRTDQFNNFIKLTKPNKNSKVLDVGTSSDETLKDSNMFEKLYPWPKKITAATIENPTKLKKLYPKIQVVKVYPGKRLPFKNNSFDLVVSWATLEHVGGYAKQQEFINELLRVGKKVYITTPNRMVFYEPHSGLPFIHWLPLTMFRKICKIIDKDFWSKEENLNPLFAPDIKRMKINRKVKVKIYKMFKVINSHIIITN